MAHKVLFYTDSPETGGAELALLQVMEGLDRSMWLPALACPPHPGLDRLRARAAGLGAPVLSAPDMPLGAAGARKLPEFMRLLRRQQPDVFHASLSWPLAGKWALVAAIFSRVPAIVACDQLFVEADYSRLTRWQQRLIAGVIDAHLPVSQATGDRLSQVFGIPTEKIQVIKNSVRSEILAPFEGPKPDLIRNESRPVVLTVARLHAQKGLSDLVAAAAQVPEAVFVVLGEGEERPALEAQARAAGLSGRLHLVGQVENILAWLCAGDLFVLSSYYEGLPLSILEAMAAGLPVLATDIPGTREVVRPGETGWLVPPAQPEALAQGIQTLLKDRELASRLALAGQAMVRAEYRPEKMVAEISGVYRRILVQKGRIGR